MSEAPLPRRRRAPRSTLPPRHRRPSRGAPIAIGAIVVGALIWGARKGLREMARSSRVDDRPTAEEQQEALESARRLLAELRESPLVPIAERRFLVDAKAVAAAGGSAYQPAPRLGKYEKAREPGVVQISYVYEGGTDATAFEVVCFLSRFDTVETAQAEFKKIQAEFDGLRPFAGRPGLFAETGAAGNRAFALRGKHLLSFGCFDISLDDTQLEKLITPYVNRMTAWDD